MVHTAGIASRWMTNGQDRLGGLRQPCRQPFSAVAPSHRRFNGCGRPRRFL